MFNNNVASTITAQGRDLTRTMHRVNEEYWYNQWHLDTELHRNVCVKNVRKVNNDYIRRIGGDIVIDPAPEQLTGHDGDLPEVIRRVPVSIYADTDSTDSSSIVRTSSGVKTIEEWYNDNIQNGSAGDTLKGHESVHTNDRILNYTDKNGLYMADVTRIIRHKVTKKKWKLKTKSGKEIIVTNDHSMIVFRDGIQMEVKPSDIRKTDRILIVREE